MSNTPKKVIVSGVSGQDGSYMVDHLLATTDHLVYGMVRRTAKSDYSNLSLAMSNPRFTFVTGDLSDTASIDNLVREIRPDYLVNLAAQSFVGSSWAIAETTFDANAVGVLRILEAVRKHAPHCRVYSAGTSEEFGRVEYSPQDEKHPLRPQSPYGAAKCAARHLVRVYRESYHLFAIHSTLFNHESPRRGVEFVTRKITLGVARIAKAIRDGVPFEPIELGNLDARRDWSDARDFVEGIWMMLNQERPAEYVLGSGEVHTVREFVELAFAEAGITGPHNGSYIGSVGLHEQYGAHLPNWTPLVTINPSFYRPAEVALLHADSSRARAELGWAPKRTFSQLVSDMVTSDLRAAGL